ncbi:Kelch repeat-containing protein [Streptomyces naphthomycinicus]|uniref:Kelch repeat-containing protein n=1 Tax=Streptomyces naphthomycinicus TaxID=2872625 RepID=UPI001CEC1DE5|nr:kelch-like protein [Streptomyces sp. TML10]
MPRITPATAGPVPSPAVTTETTGTPGPAGPPGAAEAAAAVVGSWAPAQGDLPAPAYFAPPSPSAVVLGDPYGNQVLIAGGEDATRGALKEALLFDPVERTWEPTGSLNVSRRLHSTTLLKNGQVMVAGGLTGPFTLPLAPVSSVEIYDPVGRSWKVTGALREARFAHAAVLLGDGRVLVTGGLAPRDSLTDTALSSAEIYDPGTEEWTPAAGMHDARGGHPLIPLGQDRVLAVGGMVVVGRGTYAALGYCEVYDPAAGPIGTWTPTGSLRVPRKGHQATRLADGSVLVTGGDSTGRQEDWTYNAYSQWVTERYLPDGNPAKARWNEVEPMSVGRSHHRAVALRSGKVLVIGGTDDATFDTGYQNAEVYDPGANTWTPTGGMVTGRWAAAATELKDGRVLAAGGLVRSGAATPDGTDVATGATELFTL